ncbi:hypothetical protein ABZ695_19000 [Streptomyces sp. NPDC006976]|uniref:hypothetical protein n=1 Tax=Streptomyces sp. NPDC006976 TaxID=3154311 RepID=UPI0033E3698C
MDNADSEPQSVQRVYAERFAADLAANRSEQGELTAHIAELQARVGQLKEDESWLAGMRAGLPGEAASPRPSLTAEAGTAAVGEDAPATGAVPQPRPAKGSQTTAARPGPAGKASAATKGSRRKAPRKAAEKKGAAAGAAGTSGAPLHQLIHALMPAGEPQLAREVHVALEKAHPDRKTSVQVVRNTLETLVKKGLIGKRIQKGAAMYTAAVPAGTAPTAGQRARAGAAAGS